MKLNFLRCRKKKKFIVPLWYLQLTEELMGQTGHFCSFGNVNLKTESTCDGGLQDIYDGFCSVEDKNTECESGLH
jgi:hypothetical protein